MAGIFGEFLLVSVSQETKHEKSSKSSRKIGSKITGKIRDENSKDSGKFCSVTFLTQDNKHKQLIVELWRNDAARMSQARSFRCMKNVGH